MKKIALGAVATLTSVLAGSAAFAADCITNPTLPQCQPAAVPEISAANGVAALAAVVAVAALVWERSRRAA